MQEFEKVQIDEIVTRLLGALMDLPLEDLKGEGLSRQIFNVHAENLSGPVSGKVQSVVELAIDTAILMKM